MWLVRADGYVGMTARQGETDQVRRYLLALEKPQSRFTGEVQDSSVSSQRSNRLAEWALAP